MSSLLKGDVQVQFSKTLRLIFLSKISVRPQILIIEKSHEVEAKWKFLKSQNLCYLQNHISSNQFKAALKYP